MPSTKTGKKRRGRRETADEASPAFGPIRERYSCIFQKGEFFMNHTYPDWLEERFGDDIPDWAVERWGDDDEDDAIYFDDDDMDDEDE